MNCLLYHSNCVQSGRRRALHLLRAYFHLLIILFRIRLNMCVPVKFWQVQYSLFIQCTMATKALSSGISMKKSLYLWKSQFSALSIKCLLLYVQFTMSTKALQYVLPLVSSASFWMYNSQCLQKHCSMFCHKYQVPSAVCTSHDVYKSTVVCSAISIKCLLLNVQFSMSTKALQYVMP